MARADGLAVAAGGSGRRHSQSHLAAVLTSADFVKNGIQREGAVVAWFAVNLG